ncbi:MAG: hypothetical protein CMO20_02750 [Thermoplasmata archaeon]|nr:hypothetical protein [Thermoplasmata archaeon]
MPEAVTVRTDAVYASVTVVLLRDGLLTREEQKLATKLAILLFKDDELITKPKEIYDLVVQEKEVTTGRKIGKRERMIIYREMFETAFMNASLSNDEMAVIAMLRSALQITDNEHEEVIDLVKSALEVNIEPKLLEKVKDELTSVLDLLSGMFDPLRPKKE